MAEITPPETALFTGVVGDPIAGLSVDDKGPTHLLPPVVEPTPPTPDPDPPVVSNVTPSAGTELTPDSTVGFDLTDNVAILAAFVYVIYPDLGEAEAVHDGATFLPRFVGLSSRSTIASGFRYTLRRSGGWRSTNIDVRVRALDAAGNESS